MHSLISEHSKCRVLALCNGRALIYLASALALSVATTATFAGEPEISAPCGPKRPLSGDPTQGIPSADARGSGCPGLHVGHGQSVG